MMRSFLGFSKKPVAAEAATASVLNEVVPSCPSCGNALRDHQYRLIAATPLKPDRMDSFRQLLAAIRGQEWQRVVTFQAWEGDQANAEVYGLRCANKALSVVVISAPFALEEPYMLMHQEKVADLASFESYLPDSEAWHQL